MQTEKPTQNEDREPVPIIGWGKVSLVQYSDSCWKIRVDGKQVAVFGAYDLTRHMTPQELLHMISMLSLDMSQRIEKSEKENPE